MPDLAIFINSIPVVATSPYAFGAYLLTILAWIIIAYRVARNRNIQEKIKQYPEADRIRVITAEMGAPVPPGMTAEEWIRYKRMALITYALIVFLVCVAVVVCIALFFVNVVPDTEQNSQMKLTNIKSAELQVSSVDDYMQVYVNDHLVEDATFGATPPWRSFKEFLRTGPNAIKVVINNGRYGGCGGVLNFRLNGKVYEALRRSWSTPRLESFENSNCTLEVFTMNFD